MAVHQEEARPAGAAADVVTQALLVRDDERFAPLGAPGDAEGIRWLDVDPSVEPDAAFAAVAPFCDAGLAPEHLAELLSPADQGRRASLAWRDGEIRLVRAFSAAVEEPAPGEGAGALLLTPVNLLAGDGWLLSCWHPTRRYRGARRSDADPAGVSIDACTSAIQRRWVAGRGRTAADLGVLVLHELALTFPAAHRAVAEWLEDWELRLYRDDELDEAALPELWGAMALLRDWIKPLNRFGARDDVDRGWFRGATDADEVGRVDDRIDRSLRELAELGAVLRSSFAMQQSRLEERERERSDERARRLEYIAALFLVPTLVVGFYGANTRLPGGGSWSGFAAMLAAMVILTALGVYAIWRRGDHDPPAR